MYKSPTVAINVNFPGTELEPSLIDVSITSQSVLNPAFPSGTTIYDGWCLDKSSPLNAPGSYTAQLYSSYELGVLAANSPIIGANSNLANLDNINWLLNYYDGKNPGITSGEVQAAIWKMLGQDYLSEASYLGPVDPGHVGTLYNLAMAQGDGYAPDAGGVIGAIIDPITPDGTHHQPLIIETKAARLGDLVWDDRNADGIQQSGESGIAGVTVQLVRDMNADGKFSSDEILASTVTDSAGNYSFKALTPGLDYEVRFVQPAGYDGISPRQADGSAGSGTNSDGLLSDVVVLKPGENNTTLDAGFYKTAALGDRVWQDSNGNGVQDDTASEPGMAGVLVKLIDASGSVAATQLTDSLGNYLFTGLVPGSYSVQFVAPQGYGFTGRDAAATTDALDSDADTVSGKTGSYTLASGDVNRTVDAGLVVLKAHLGDFVWEDKNANGVQDVGEAGISGVTVNLLNSAGNVVASTTTAGNGSYGFDVAPGTYAVQFVKPSGYAITTQDAGSNSQDGTDSDANPTTGITGTYTLAAGANNPTIDAGLYKLAQLGDRVWYDSNGNGIQDTGETGVSGVVIDLVNDSTGAVVGTTTTDNNGQYLFSNLVPGTYHPDIRENTLPAGYAFTAESVGSDRSVDSNVTTRGGANPLSWGVMTSTTLVSGQSDLSSDAGIVAIKAHLGDFVWEDKNANGLQDSGEAGINGVTVNLLNSAGNVVASTTTAGNGSYGFDVAPGTYAVQFIKPSGYTITTQDAANNSQDGADSDASPATGITGTYTLAAGANNPTIDAGLYKVAQLGDRVWYDSNGNGIQDAGEAGACGVAVTLLNAAGTAVATQTTNASGNYLFTNLTPGTYSVQFGTVAGYGYTTKDASGNSQDASDSDADTTTGRTGSYTLNSGDSNLTVDAGLLAKKAHIGDLVWEDKNANGIQDAGEGGIGGVTVNLLNTAGSIVAATTTNASGAYGFDVAPGTYAVQFVTPGGYVNSPVNQGGNSGLDSDANPANGKTGNYTLAPGDNNLTVDAGLYKTASIGDRVWFDTNKNGIQDSGETGVAGVKVDLYLGSTKVATDTTDAKGNYLFSGLTPGAYHADVQESTLPANYAFTARSQGSNNAIDSDADSKGVMATTTLASGEVDLTWDAGIYYKDPLTAAVGDRVWRDHNENGIQDTGGTEPGIPGVHVSLYTSAGALVGKQDTNSNGNYLFSGLAAGDYYVQFDKTNVNYNAPSPNPGNFTLNTWNFAQRDVGSNDTIDSDAGSAAGKTLVNVASTQVFHLNAGQVDLTRDAGLTPLVIDLDGDGIHTIARSSSGGSFDLLGNGHAITSGWISAGDAFLAVDRNGNGQIDDIGELFGGTSKGSGFAKLASYDSNGDGVVDARDAGFADLRVWQDANGNHVTDAGELRTLAQAGITSLAVSYTDQPYLDAQGNLHGESSSVTLSSGAAVNMTDVYFNVDAAEAAAAGVALPTMGDLLADTRTLDAVVGPAAPATHSVTTAAEPVHDGNDAGEAMRRLAALTADPHSGGAAP